MPFYEVAAWRRQNNAAAVPTFTEVENRIILAEGLEWSKELYGDGQITVKTDPTKIPQSLAESMVNMSTKPSELGVFRDGVLVQRGPLVAWETQGKGVTLHAKGLLYYLHYMTVTADVDYNINQVLIAKDLIDDYQAKTRGNYGLVTTSMTSAGSTRERSYLAADLIDINEEIRALGEADNGFDIIINPSTRVITCHNPTLGTDKSLLVVFDLRGVAGPSMSDSVAAGQFGTAALVAGVPEDSDPVVVESIDNTTRDLWGLAHVTHTASGVASSAEVTQIATRTRDVAKRSVFLPPREHFAVWGATVVDFDIGDTVTVEYNAGFSMMTYVGRVKAIHVSVQEGGQDKISLEFV